MNDFVIFIQNVQGKIIQGKMNRNFKLIQDFIKRGFITFDLMSF